MNAKFYICRHCGNIVEMVRDAKVPVMCCGQKMELLEPNTVEASGEKHKPVVTVSGDAVHVEVGSVAHPCWRSTRSSGCIWRQSMAGSAGT